MSWLLRFLGWSTVLAVPCVLLMKPYQHVLARVAEAVLEAAGTPVRIGELRLQEPFNLGVFAAMSLAGVRTPMGERFRRMAWGIAALAVLGLVLVVLVVGGHEIARRNGFQLEGGVQRFLASWIEAIPWLSAPFAWILLFGRYEIARSRG